MTERLYAYRFLRRDGHWKRPNNADTCADTEESRRSVAKAGIISDVKQEPFSPRDADIEQALRLLDVLCSLRLIEGNPAFVKIYHSHCLILPPLGMVQG